MVLTFNFGANVSMHELARRAPLATWFMRPAVVSKLSNPRTTCLIFASGKALVVGVKSAQQGLLAAWHVAFMLRECGVAGAAVYDFNARNVTSTMYMGAVIDIMKLEGNPGPLHYGDLESDLFPGIYLKPLDKSVHITVACFTSGHVNVTGALNAAQTEKQFNSVAPYIRDALVFDPEEQARVTKRIQQHRTELRLRGRRTKKAKRARVGAAG